jgi:hypothetical protein
MSDSINSFFQNIGNNVRSFFGNTTSSRSTTNYDRTSSNLSSFGRPSGLKDFLNSGSWLAQFSFIMIVIIVFIILLYFSMFLLQFIMNKKQNVIGLFSGMVDGKQLIVFPQDPVIKGAKTLYRSVDERSGVEFTWSAWIFIDDLTYMGGQYRHIFHKGNLNIDTSTGLNFPNNAPGLYISPNSNELTMIMNTYDTINEQVTIPNIPLNKWFNIIIRCKNNRLDIYINGLVTKSVQLLGVPKQNYGDIYVGLNGGFSGNISNLTYYNYAVDIYTIQTIMNSGPNTKLLNYNKASSTKIRDNYLSLKWYFSGNQDMFNP